MPLRIAFLLKHPQFTNPIRTEVAPGASTAPVGSSSLYSSISAKPGGFGDEDGYSSDSQIPAIDIEPDTEGEDEIDEY